MLAFVSIPFVHIGMLTDVKAHLRAIAPARSLGKFPHTCKLDFDREHPSPTSHCRAGESGNNYLDEARLGEISEGLDTSHRARQQPEASASRAEQCSVTVLIQ